MGLRNLVAGAVLLAKNITNDLQPYVSHQTASGEGVVTYSAAVQRKALVVYKQGAVRRQDGQLVQYRAVVYFLEDVVVTMQDIVTLPDGTTGPIVNIGGFADRLTGRSYYKEVYLG